MRIFSKPNFTLISGLVLFSCLLIYIFLRSEFLNFEKFGTNTKPSLDNLSQSPKSANQEPNPRPPNTRHDQVPGEDNYVDKKIESLKNILNTQETKRCKLIKEIKYEDATSYFLSANPPSDEEIDFVRKYIAQALDDIVASKKNEIDKRFGELIVEYDPFGYLGLRVVSIRVPNDPNEPISAWTYPVNNIETEIEKLSRRDGEPLAAPENMSLYVSSDNESLYRFGALLSKQ